MNKYQHYMVFIIALLLTGCGSLPVADGMQATETLPPTKQVMLSPTNTPTQEPSPMLTLTPTAAVTPTPAPTWTPLPAISSDDEVRKIMQQWLEGTPDCMFPCFAGIIPRETKWDTALYMLNPVLAYFNEQRNSSQGSWVGAGKCRYDNCNVINFRFTFKKALEYYNVTLFNKNDLVYSINIQGNASPNFSIQKVFENYGQPSQIYLNVNPNSDYTKYSPALEMILFYPEKKLVIFYTLHLTVSNSNLVACLSSPYTFSLGIVGITDWNEDDITSVGDQSQNAFVLAFEILKPIAEATDMTVEDFYQNVLENGTNSCIRTPQKLWP